jgi:hypothetical protein
VKIGQLERTHQVFRREIDHQRGYPSGSDLVYWCTRCGDVVASVPLNEVRHCECGNLFFDAGRFEIEDKLEVVLLAIAPTTASRGAVAVVGERSERQGSRTDFVRGCVLSFC